MDNRPRVVVSGSNRGLSLALAQHNAHLRWEVTGICRIVSEELQETATSVIEEIDLTHDRGIDEVVSRLEKCPIDVLLRG